MRSPDQAAAQAKPQAKPARDSRGRLLPGGTSNPHGWRITKIKAAERAEDRKRLAAELEADLGREPTRREQLLIEAASAAAIEAREFRRKGKSSIEQDRLVCRTLRALGLEADAPAPRPSLREYLRDGGT